LNPHGVVSSNDVGFLESGGNGGWAPMLEEAGGTMTIEVRDHSIEGWRDFARAAGFVPDPMILRTGEVFINGLSGVRAFNKPDLEVWAALQQNLVGLSDFFDLVVTRDRIPLIDYRYTFDVDGLARPLEQLLGLKALPVTIDYGPYDIIKQGAFNSLRQIDLERVRSFGNQLQELDSLRYDWQPELRDYRGEASWLSNVDALDVGTQRAARFLLGGFIFSGFAQASGTDHYIQPKRSRFFLSLTAAQNTLGQIGHDAEQSIFNEALEGLKGTSASVRQLDGLPPVLPYLIAKAPPGATAADLLQLALAFPDTPDGRLYCGAAAVLRQDGAGAKQMRDRAVVARDEAIKMLKPFTTLAERDGGFRVEASLGTEGPKLAISKELSAPGWLRFWWNDHTPWGGIRKTFRRMWMASESYHQFERQIHAIWIRS
jgi:hypothetical protein